jgi:hypothetical protein
MILIVRLFTWRKWAHFREQLLNTVSTGSSLRY